MSILAGGCLLLVLLAMLLRPVKGGKRPLDSAEIRRVRRFADQMRREEALPYE
jgi:hypothetical protein